MWQVWHPEGSAAPPCVASAGFVAYSVMVDNRVFIVTNSAILVTAVVGQCIVARRRARYAAEMEGQRMRLPDFPAMYALSEPLSEAERARRSGDDFAFHIYGQSAALNRELPASELMRLLVAEAKSAFRAMATAR